VEKENEEIRGEGDDDRERRQEREKNSLLTPIEANF
jgi:hypothetical protein